MATKKRKRKPAWMWKAYPRAWYGIRRDYNYEARIYSAGPGWYKWDLYRLPSFVQSNAGVSKTLKGAKLAVARGAR